VVSVHRRNPEYSAFSYSYVTLMWLIRQRLWCDPCVLFPFPLQTTRTNDDAV